MSVSGEGQFYRVAWIYTYDRRTDQLIGQRRASTQEIREIEAEWPAIEDVPLPAGSPVGAGPDGGEGIITITYSSGTPAPPRFEHDAAARVFRLTAPDSTVETFRDNPTRYLCVEPGPDGGEMRPVMQRGRPVDLYLCREGREAP